MHQDISPGQAQWQTESPQLEGTEEESVQGLDRKTALRVGLGDGEEGFYMKFAQTYLSSDCPKPTSLPRI